MLSPVLEESSDDLVGADAQAYQQQHVSTIRAYTRTRSVLVGIRLKPTGTRVLLRRSVQARKPGKWQCACLGGSDSL